MMLLTALVCLGMAVSVDISVWGRAAEGWEALVTRRFDIQAGEHKHLTSPPRRDASPPDGGARRSSC